MIDVDKLCSRDLNKFLVLQSQYTTPDGSGGQILEWVNDMECWAYIKAIPGIEIIRGEQIQASLTHEIAIRWRAGVNNKMRAVFFGRLFNIKHAVNPEEKNEWWVLTCAEGVGT